MSWHEMYLEHKRALAAFDAEEPTQERERTEPVIVYGDRPDLAERVSAKVGTPYSVFLDLERRGPQNNCAWMMASCRRCEKKLSIGCDPQENTPEYLADYLAQQVLQCREDGYFEVGDCTCVDGLTEEECLARYQARMREGLRDRDEDHWDMQPDRVVRTLDDRLSADGCGGDPAKRREFRYPRGFRLNEAQLSAARLAWSRELSAKQEQAREKERNEIVVDDDRWEP